MRGTNIAEAHGSRQLMRRSLLPECLALCRNHAADPDEHQCSTAGNDRHLPRSLLDRWRLRMQVLGLSPLDADTLRSFGSGQGDTGAPVDQGSSLSDIVLPSLLAATNASMAREGLLAQTELLRATGGYDTQHGVGAVDMYAILQQALTFSPGSSHTSFLTAAMQLATALAELTCTHVPPVISHTDPALITTHITNNTPPTIHPQHPVLPAQPLPTSTITTTPTTTTPDITTLHATKRKRTEPEQVTAAAPLSQPHQQPSQQHHHQLGEDMVHVSNLSTQITTSTFDDPPLTTAHAAALHRGLISWTSHWHPRVRAGALEGLMAAHGSRTHLKRMTTTETTHVPWSNAPDTTVTPTTHNLHTPTSSFAPPPASIHDPSSISIPHMYNHPVLASPQTPMTRSFISLYQCSSLNQVESAYSTAVVCLADDQEDVRMRAMGLLSTLSCAHPHLCLLGARWLQLDMHQTLVDDAMQRLAGCVTDGEARVREKALELMAGLPACSVRVKLQLLSKKATISVAAATPMQGEGGGGPPQHGKGMGGQDKGRQPGRGVGAVGAGAVTRRQGQADVHWSWCGGPMTRGLDLLDVSVGALVRGSEDEDQQVRMVTVKALVSFSVQEVMAIIGAQTNTTTTTITAPAALPTSSTSRPPGPRGGAYQGPVKAGGVGSSAHTTAVDTGSMRQVVAQSVEHLCDLMQDEIECVRSAAVWGVHHLIRTANVPPDDQVDNTGHGQPGSSAAPACGSASSSASHQVPAMSVLTADQLSEVFPLLYDRFKDVRSGARELVRLETVGHRSWGVGLIKGLAFCVARALPVLGVEGGGPEEVQELMSVMRGLAYRAQVPARAVAVEIAQMKQRQAQGGGVGAGGMSGAGDGNSMTVGREHLKVMHALLQGVGDVK